MDKKNYGILAPKSLTGPVAQDTSSRARQDGSGGNQTIKNHPRTTPRRRESPTSHSNAVKTRSEAAPVRKPTPQKSKAMDKRPRARGGSTLQSVEEDESKRGPELGSLQTPGSKKQSLNHLLNFHFAPRDNRALSAGSWRSYNTHPGGGWRARHNSGGTALRPKFNKENFLQANCQFLVKSTGDYSVHQYNPDVLVDWEMIEQIYIRVSGEFPNCPICLSPPVAAKMTKCGHIFCWPCLLHYLALSDKKCRKCPICFESVYKHELKSVVATHYDDVHVGEELEMQLMFRKKGLFQAMPLMCKDGPTFNWESVFSKLLPVGPAEVKEIVLERETRELQLRYEEEKHCPEVCFVEQAMSELETRMSNVKVIDTGESPTLNKVLGALNLAGVECMSTDSSPSSDDTISFQVDDRGAATKQRNDSLGNDSVATTGSDEDTSVGKSDDYFYFYQAMKGENIFLHPINMAMLWKSFGNDPTTWPQVVQFRVIEKEYVIMMDDVRKRLKFLQHLPLTSNVQLIEVELKPPIVTEEVLAEFVHQLDSRKKRRIQRAREERRRERKLEEEERKRDHLHQCPRFEFKHDFPEYNCYDFTESALSGNLNEADVYVPHEDSNVTTTDDENLGMDRNSNLDLYKDSYSTSPSGMSFAQIVSQRTASQAAAKQGGAWGSSWKSAERNGSASSSKEPEKEAESGEYTSVPAYRMSMSDAIARAIANVEGVEDVDTCQGNSNGKKKGRKKGKVLFATGMGCYNK
ncbi:unnamed protein product [Allacma fusca]|uniref:E3 ubiquitin-protein ligase RNF10 n=1 Tax=Allacma fusca TaxID=39272 RepID=A0A8J2LW32_9HEXA|nr:unnamed protein product [Allacma fusca]